MNIGPPWPPPHDWTLLPAGSRQPALTGCAGNSARSKRQLASPAIAALRSRSVTPSSTALSAAGSAPARCTRSPPRARRKPPLPAASRSRSRREGHRGGERRPRSAIQATRARATTSERFLSLRDDTCSGSPRISRLPKMARRGPGLDGIGIAPERLITVAAARGRDVLWAMEEALRCRAVGMVIGEMRPRDIDQVATRRLALAAAAGNALGLILRTAPDDGPSAAATRWIVGAAPSLNAERGHGVGPPRLLARLVRNRRGHLGAWIVEWNSVEQRFELATHSEPVAGSAFDRPHRTAVA